MHFVAWFWSRCREIRGLYDRIKWLWRNLIEVLLAVASGALAVIYVSVPDRDYLIYFRDGSNVGTLFEAVAIVTLVYSGITFASTLRVSVVFEPHRKLRGSSIRIEEGFAVSEFNEQAILYSPEVNRLLEGASNPVRFNRRRFQLHPLVREMLPLFLLRMPESSIDTTDDPKVRQYTDLTPELLRCGGDVYLQQTSYFRDRLSNTLANYRVRLENRELLDLRREVVDAAGELVSLKESKLSNQLGGSVLLITSDSAIVYMRQGNRTDENAGLLAPTGSGSFDAPSRRQPSRWDFQGFVKQETLRELCEECGMPTSDIIGIQICGFGRYLYRNGKPEVFCIATTRRDSQSIVVPIREWDYQQQNIEVQGFDGMPSPENAIKGLKTLLKRLDDRAPGFEAASGPLYWNIQFAITYLDQLTKDGARLLFEGA